MKPRCARRGEHRPTNGPSKLARCLLQQGGLVRLPLRTSNDYGFIVGVPRTQEIDEATLPPRFGKLDRTPKQVKCSPARSGQENETSG